MLTCNQSSFACNFNATHKHGEVMASDLNVELQTQLAAEILTLFHRANLTAPQARSLLDKVRILVDAGEIGLFKQSH